MIQYPYLDRGRGYPLKLEPSPVSIKEAVKPPVFKKIGDEKRYGTALKRKKRLSKTKKDSLGLTSVTEDVDVLVLYHLDELISCWPQILSRVEDLRLLS